MRKRTTTQFKSIRINHINRIKVQKKIEQQQSKQKRKKEIIDLREKKKKRGERVLGDTWVGSVGEDEEEEEKKKKCHALHAKMQTARRKKRMSRIRERTTMLSTIATELALSLSLSNF